MDGQGDRAERIDNYLDWLYPISYIVAVAALVVWFF
jgi:hypothetical protein